MNKQQFLTELEKNLYGLPQDDIQVSLDYYAEMIDDRIEDGLSEQEAVAAIGNPEKIAKQILMDVPLPKLVKAKTKPRHTLRAWEIVLLVLGSPIWLSLAFAVVAVILSVYVSLWSIVISLWACEAAFCGSALGSLVSVVWLLVGNKNICAAFIMIAATLFLIGFSILFFFACRASTKGIIWITKKIMLWIKSCFLRKERAQ